MAKPFGKMQRIVFVFLNGEKEFAKGLAAYKRSAIMKMKTIFNEVGMKKHGNRPTDGKKDANPALDLSCFLSFFGEAILIRVGHGKERVFFGKPKK